MSTPTRADVIILPPNNKPRRIDSPHSVATGAATGTDLWARANVNLVASTDATPIVVQLASGHGFETGDWVVVSGHTTNVGANGSWRVSAYDATHITLEGSVGSGAGNGGATGTVNFANPAPRGLCWVTFAAIGQDVYLRIGDATSAGTTTANGAPILAGHTASFYLNPKRHLFVDAYAPGGVGALNWWVSSPIVERDRTEG